MSLDVRYRDRPMGVSLADLLRRNQSQNTSTSTNKGSRETLVLNSDGGANFDVDGIPIGKGSLDVGRGQSHSQSIALLQDATSALAAASASLIAVLGGTHPVTAIAQYVPLSFY